MASLFITEFDQLVITSNAVPPFGKFNGNTVNQTPVAIGSGSLASTAFAKTTAFIRVVADADCAVSYTPPGVDTIAATADSMFIPASVPQYFGVDAGGVLSAITAS